MGHNRHDGKRASSCDHSYILDSVSPDHKATAPQASVKETLKSKYRLGSPPMAPTQGSERAKECFPFLNVQVKVARIMVP